MERRLIPTRQAVRNPIRLAVLVVGTWLVSFLAVLGIFAAIGTMAS